jgi:4-amino-4-deoxychorismate lyase
MNGMMQNTLWHQHRYEKSFWEFYGRPVFNQLTDNIDIPAFCRSGIFRMRISYNEVSKIVEFEEYSVKEINTLQLVKDDTIEYNLKYSDRSHLQKLLEGKGMSDDILIVKNGLITDSSFCNIVFFDGSEWITPATPLLRGTARERLLASGTIKEQNIRFTDIKNFHRFKLINSMRDFKYISESEVINIFG